MSQGSDHDPGRGLPGADPGAWDHLGRLIRERRAELGLTQREVHSVGGPSPATLYQLESGHRGSYRPHILRRLERALGWGAGSVRRVLAGGLPLLDGDSAPGSGRPPDRRTTRRLPDDRTTGVDSLDWVADFRRLPIDTRDKLVILSSLLQEMIADLGPGRDGRSHLDSRGTLRGERVAPRSGTEAGTT